jgi:hypothetical protein
VLVLVVVGLFMWVAIGPADGYRHHRRLERKQRRRLNRKIRQFHYSNGGAGDRDGDGGGGGLGL